MFKNKKLVIISIIAAIIIIGGLIFWLVSKNIHNNSAPKQANPNSSALPAPQFLNNAEKLQLGLPPETRVQSLKQDASGAVTVYKIIKTDQDIVADPSKIGSISPRQESAAPILPTLPNK